MKFQTAATLLLSALSVRHSYQVLFLFGPQFGDIVRELTDGNDSGNGEDGENVETDGEDAGINSLVNTVSFLPKGSRKFRNGDMGQNTEQSVGDFGSVEVADGLADYQQTGSSELQGKEQLEDEGQSYQSEGDELGQLPGSVALKKATNKDQINIFIIEPKKKKSAKQKVLNLDEYIKKLNKGKNTLTINIKTKNTQTTKKQTIKRKQTNLTNSLISTLKQQKIKQLLVNGKRVPIEKFIDAVQKSGLYVNGEKVTAESILKALRGETVMVLNGMEGSDVMLNGKQFASGAIADIETGSFHDDGFTVIDEFGFGSEADGEVLRSGQNKQKGQKGKKMLKKEKDFGEDQDYENGDGDGQEQ